jgi:transposase
VWDGEGAVGRWRARRTELTMECQGFRGTLGAKVIICKPADPEAKGLVERFHDYVERSFLPGRRFTSPEDFNSQLTEFMNRANSRQHRVLGCRPIDRLNADRQAMLSLPPVPPMMGWQQMLRLPRDHYVRLDGNDYSVHPSAVGHRVVVRADLDRVRVACEGSLVADHERVWARHQSISAFEHLLAARQLRRRRMDLIRPPAQTEVEVRPLADYDNALGITANFEGGLA